MIKNDRISGLRGAMRKSDIVVTPWASETTGRLSESQKKGLKDLWGLS